jgi:hypothetical protein
MKLLRFLIFLITFSNFAYSQVDTPDLRTFDIRKSSPDEKKKMDNFWKFRIQGSESYMQSIGILDLWDKIAQYIEGFQYPVGFWDNNFQTFVHKNAHKMFNVNSFQVHKDEAGFIFFADNRIGEIEKGYMGEFTGAKKMLHARHDDNPRNDGLEYAVKNYVSKHEYQYRVWEQVRTPSIRNMMRYNVGYERAMFNPFTNIKKGGSIDVEYFYPWHVLIDPTAIKRFLLDSRYIIPFKVVPLEEAKTMLSALGVDPNKVKPDKNSDIFTGKRNSVDFKYAQDEPTVTIYFPEARQMRLADYNEGMEVTEKGELSDSQVKETIMEYYQGVYTKDLGMVYWYKNLYADPRMLNEWQFACAPYVNEHSDVTILSAGTLGKMLILQDILNVLQTMRLNNARQKSLIRGFVLKSVYDAWGKQLMDEVMSKGGFLPFPDEKVDELDKVIKFIELPDQNEPIDEFLATVEGALKRQGIRQDVLAGRAPTKTSERMSGKLARELKQANATVLEPIVQAIEWTVGTTARRMYNILALEFDEDDWVEITDAKKNDPKYIPINAVKTLKEYNDYLQKAYPKMDPNEAAKKFEEHNDVRLMEIENTDDNGNLRDAKDVLEKYSKVEINHLRAKDGSLAGFTFKAVIDFDIEDNDLEQKILITKIYLQDPKNPVWADLFFHSQGGELEARADEFVEKLNNYYGAMPIIDAINKNPELKQLIGLLTEKPELIQGIMMMLQKAIPQEQAA